MRPEASLIISKFHRNNAIVVKELFSLRLFHFSYLQYIKFYVWYKSWASCASYRRYFNKFFIVLAVGYFYENQRFSTYLTAFYNYRSDGGTNDFSESSDYLSLYNESAIKASPDSCTRDVKRNLDKIKHDSFSAITNGFTNEQIMSVPDWI